MATRNSKTKKNKLFTKTNAKKDKPSDVNSDISGVYGVLATGFNKSIKIVKPISKKRKNYKIKKPRKTQRVIGSRKNNKNNKTK